MQYIKIIEKKLGIKAKINYKILQKGDVKATLSSITKSKRELNYKPKINIQEGIDNYIKWFKKYYKFNEHILFFWLYKKFKLFRKQTLPEKLFFILKR